MKLCYFVIIALTLSLIIRCAAPTSRTPPPSSLAPTPAPPAIPTLPPPIETGKGRIMTDQLGNVPEKIITRKIVDQFLIGVGTTDPRGWVSSAVLKDLRVNGVNYFLPFTSWASIERTRGIYTDNPCPGKSLISWLANSGGVLNGHCLIFLLDEEWNVPRFTFSRTFNEQKEMIKEFVRTTVSQFPEIQIWTLNGRSPRIHLAGQENRFTMFSFLHLNGFTMLTQRQKS